MGGSRSTISTQRAITGAIARGDGPAAERAARRHLEESRIQVLSVDPLMTVNVTG